MNYFYFKDAGCQRKNWKKFKSKYYPDKNAKIPVTPENFVK